MWYDALYANDPSTDNTFGREDLARRHNAALLHHLRQGGRLLDFAASRRPGPLTARLDSTLNLFEQAG